MNRDEILAKSRSENKGEDERELLVSYRAGYISKAIGAFICVMLTCLEVFISNGSSSLASTACYAIFCVMNASELWIKAIILKGRRNWIGAISFSLLSIGFVVLYLCKLI